eukprot:1202589-Rhodomonas_salina.1
MFGAPSRQACSLHLAAPLHIFLLAVTGVSAENCLDRGDCVGCSDTSAANCHGLAMCDQEPEDSQTPSPAYHCECHPDLFGDGMGADGCSSEAAVVRT